jgi:hypothetical protein
VNVTFLFLINAGRVPVSILHVFSWSLDSLALRAAAFQLAVRGGVARAAQLLFTLP